MSVILRIPLSLFETGQQNYLYANIQLHTLRHYLPLVSVRLNLCLLITEYIPLKLFKLFFPT